MPAPILVSLTKFVFPLDHHFHSWVHVLSTRNDVKFILNPIIFRLETLKATIKEKKEEQVVFNAKIKELEANLKDSKGYRERQLKEAKDHMQKMKEKSDKSRKDWEKREKVWIDQWTPK